MASQELPERFRQINSVYRPLRDGGWVTPMRRATGDIKGLAKLRPREALRVNVMTDEEVQGLLFPEYEDALLFRHSLGQEFRTRTVKSLLLSLAEVVPIRKSSKIAARFLNNNQLEIDRNVALGEFAAKKGVPVAEVQVEGPFVFEMKLGTVKDPERAEEVCDRVRPLIPSVIVVDSLVAKVLRPDPVNI